MVLWDGAACCRTTFEGRRESGERRYAARASDSLMIEAYRARIGDLLCQGRWREHHSQCNLLYVLDNPEWQR